MERIKVNSSDIKSVGYDHSNDILEIEFNSGGIYQYSNVSTIIHTSLMNASSKGSFFHRNIKDKYRFRQIS